MDRKQVMKMFNKQTRVGVLATANKSGETNAAVFGSPRMIDEDTVIMAIGDNRSAKNLQENPLCPAEVIGIGGGKFAVPVVAEAEHFQLTTESVDVFVGGDARVRSRFHRMLFGGQSECIPAHWM